MKKWLQEETSTYLKFETVKRNEDRRRSLQRCRLKK